jgi:phospholipase D1/2
MDSYISFCSRLMTFLVLQMGSANFNDRSQRVRDARICSSRSVFGSCVDYKGDGDSEIALVVEDEDFIQSTMDGRPYRAARFAASLRRKLFRRVYSLSYK